MPLTRYFPRGVNWMYDIQRFGMNREASVVFDVGANVGQTARNLSQFFSRSRIFSFEPVASTFLTLEASFRNSSNVQCIQAGLGETEDCREIAIHSNSEMNTLVLDGPHQSTGALEMVKIETADGFCRARGISAIDILKMDVQGWELNVINGARELLANNAIHFVFAEVGFRRHDSDIQAFSSFNDAMELAGFMFCGLYDVYRYGPAKQFVGFANALYINPNFDHFP